MHTTEITRDQGWALLTEFVQGESLRRHCLSVETAMRAYAAHYGEDVDAWGLMGLIHDFDFEIHPSLDQHPQDGAPILRERGYPEWVVRAILSHGEHLHIERETQLEKTLLAVDELTGFIQAVAFVQPTRAVADVTPQKVRKKMKDKAFARAIDREGIARATEELGVDLDEHIAFVISAMTANAVALGLAGVPVDAGT
jgi:putative nucleotidyltransferase with HDIG domain